MTMPAKTPHSAWITACVFALTAFTHAPRAHAHGTPIHVEVPTDQLIVSGGWPDSAGFAPMIFGEDDEDGEPSALMLPQVGPVILWQLPGLEIVGMSDQSSLSIEPLPRPAKDAAPTEQRLVWYWDPDSERSFGRTSPLQFARHRNAIHDASLRRRADEPAPFLLADPIAGQQGFHNHGLVSFALDNDPSPPAGAYGFFARLLSDEHAASNPFLLVFNHGVEPAQMMSAGLAINAAAFPSGRLQPR